MHFLPTHLPCIEIKMEFKTNYATLCHLTKNTNHFPDGCISVYPYISSHIHKIKFVLKYLRFAYRNIYLEVFIFFKSMIIFKQRNFYQHSTLPLALSDSHVFPYKVVLPQNWYEGHLCKSNISIVTTPFPFLFFSVSKWRLKL